MTAAHLDPGPPARRAGVERTVVVTGGLTGGHVMPCLTLALALGRLGHRVAYVGAAGQLEETAAARYGVEFHGLPFCRTGTWRRRSSLVRATGVARAALARLRPDTVFCKGSITGVPAVLAARTLGIPVVLHESDRVPGTETRRLAPLARLVCVGYPEAARHFRRPVLVTGNPTRPNFAGGSRERCLRRYGLPADRPVVFVVGGSQGAASLNELVRAGLPDLLGFASVVHACGPGKLAGSARRPGYVPLEYVHDEIRDLYAAADVVLSRAGAGALAEAAAYRVPAVYVPYPWAQHDHQEENARAMAAAGVAEVLAQPGLTAARLVAAVRSVLDRRAGYAANYARLAHPPTLPLLCAAVLAGPGRPSSVRSGPDGPAGEG